MMSYNEPKAMSFRAPPIIDTSSGLVDAAI